MILLRQMKGIGIFLYQMSSALSLHTRISKKRNIRYWDAHVRSICMATTTIYIFKDQKCIAEIRDQICETFPELIANNQLIVREEFFINAKVLDVEVLENIRSAVLEHGMSYPTFGDVVPQTWRDLHMELDKLRAAGTKILPYEEIQRINKTLASPLQEKELKVFVTFLHDMGYCLHFDDGYLSGFVILEPRWIIDAMKVFVTCDNFGLRFWKHLEWKKMRSSGQVKESYIVEQWRSKEKDSFHRYKRYLLLVLEKLDILCRAKFYDDRGRDAKIDFFTVPCMVNTSVPGDLRFKQPTISMHFIFQSVVPVAIYNRLVCACLALWQVYNSHLYSGFVILKSGQYHCFSLQLKNGNIFVSFLHLESQDKVDINLCRTVRQFLNTALTAIARTYRTTNADSLYTVSYSEEAISRNFGSNESQVMFFN